MKQRCPHCQTTPLSNDAETCWYCGRDYYVATRKLPRTARSAPGSAVSRRRAVRTARPARGVSAKKRSAQASTRSLRGQAEASTTAR